MNEHVQVSRRATSLSGVATAADPDALPVGDPGRHLDGDLGALHPAATSPADVARIARYAPVAAALVAGGRTDDLAERRPRHDAQLAAAPAARAGLDRRAGLGAVSVATLAQGDGLIFHLDVRAVGSHVEIDFGGHRDVAPLSGAAGPGTATEQVAEPSATEPSAAKERVEDVGHRGEGIEVRRVAAAAQSLVPVAVVGGPPLGVGEHLVGLGGLLELVLGLGIVAVDVGMELAGQPPERLLDRRLIGVPGHPKDVVVVANSAHRSSYTSATNLESWRAASRTERIARP